MPFFPYIPVLNKSYSNSSVRAFRILLASLLLEGPSDPIAASVSFPFLADSHGVILYA